MYFGHIHLSPPCPLSLMPCPFFPTSSRVLSCLLSMCAHTHLIRVACTNTGEVTYLSKGNSREAAPPGMMTPPPSNHQPPVAPPGGGGLFVETEPPLQPLSSLVFPLCSLPFKFCWFVFCPVFLSGFSPVASLTHSILSPTLGDTALALLHHSLENIVREVSQSLSYQTSGSFPLSWHCCSSGPC